MTDFNTSPAESSSPAPNKRVNYAQGMLLTVNDFRQDQEHFEWKNALGNRLLHGYGTVCGLKVLSEMRPTDVNIIIEPGYALSPAGNWIWVENLQAARLNEWVQNNRESAPDFKVPGSNHVYVTLCYDELPSNQVPMPGSPDHDPMDPHMQSRILETFRAELRWNPPQQIAEQAAMYLGSLLSGVVLTEDPRQDERDRLLERVAALAEERIPDSPRNESEEIHLWQETADETIWEGVVIFVTEVCPRLQEVDEDCVLLARVDFDVDRKGRLMPRTVQIDNRLRPILLSSRLQQELILRRETDH